MKKLIFTLIAMLLTISQVYSQFGKNRVQYKEFEWYFIQTKHFDIYFNPEGTKIAEFTAAAAEEALESINGYLNYEINNRVSMIVYNSHNDFQETNTTDSYISQGIGGFTEPFKNRVVVPFEGSYDKFRHVIHHELVHAVMRDYLYGGTVQNIISKGITLQLPLWYHEGMAEYLSSGWETMSDMFISDAIINEYLPDINGLGGYFAYRGGQSIFHYISDTYGKEKIGEMLSKIKGLNNVEEGIKSSIGLTLKELNERWKKDLKRQYWPEIANRKDPTEIAKKLTDNKETGGFYNTSPAISPQGDKIVFISDRDIYMDIYVMNSFDGEIIKKVIESGRANDFEELNVLFPSLTWAPDNKRIALSTKSDGFDRIYIMDVETEDGYELPFSLNGVESVNWSPDGRFIAFNGSDSKQSDIYIWDMDQEKLINLTNDIFSDFDPVWGPESKRIFFSSDRHEYSDKDLIPKDLSMFGYDYQKDIYSLELESGEVERITFWPLSDEKNPVVSADGSKMIFVSDYNGIDNIYKVSLDGDEDEITEPKPLTNSLNGINQLSVSQDGKKLVFTSLYDAGYNVYLLNNPFEMEPVADELEPTVFMDILRNGPPATGETVVDEKTVIESRTDTVTTKEEKVAVEEKAEENEEENQGTKIFTGQYEVEEDGDTTAIANDYSNFVFGDDTYASEEIADSTEIKNLFTESLDDQGNFLVNKYKISFSPDIVYANAGYSTFYGLLGTTVLSFSDMLGNHRIIGVTSLQIDLKNSDYGVAYYYLPKRINYGVELFHTARFVYLSNQRTSELHRFRNYGGVLSASLPISRFSRVDGSFSMLNISSENLDNLNDASERVTYFIPQVGYVYDNTMFGYTAPIEGTRARIGLFGNPGFNNSDQSFYSAFLDYRKYYRFWYDNSFAIRFSGGYSGGNNPQRFFLGGTESWINRTFATGDIPLEKASDFAFLSPALPMRGYDYAEKIGSKYSLMNLELRMPLIRYLITGPIPLFLRNILGVAFLDAGTTWDNHKAVKLFRKDENTGKLRTEDLLLGTGYGFRINFIFLWRLDIAWSYDMQHFSKPKYYLSFGLDF